MRAPAQFPGVPAITAPTAHHTTGDHIARGIVCALIGFAIFSCADAGVKWLSERYNVFQIIFISNLFTLIPVGFLIRRQGGFASLRPRHPWLVSLRAVLLAIDMVMVYYAFTKLPLADAYALLFAVPMLVTALSVPILGEFVGWRRWTAVVIGFMGVLIVLRPGLAVLNLGHISALSSALFFALSLVVLRRIGKNESAAALIFSMILALLAISAPALPYVYVAMSAADLALMAVLGLLSGLGHLMLIQAFRQAPSSIVAPFHYSQMIWAVIFGLLIFDDIPDRWVIAGSAVIIGSGLYILWRETVRGRTAA